MKTCTHSCNAHSCGQQEKSANFPARTQTNTPILLSGWVLLCLLAERENRESTQCNKTAAHGCSTVGGWFWENRLQNTQQQKHLHHMGENSSQHITTASYRRVVSETEHYSIMNTKWRTIICILVLFLLVPSIVTIRAGRKITGPTISMLLVPIDVNRSFTRVPTALVFPMNSSGEKSGHSHKNRAQWEKTESSGCRSSISICRNLPDTTGSTFHFSCIDRGKFALSVTGRTGSLIASLQFSAVITTSDWNALQHKSSVT